MKPPLEPSDEAWERSDLRLAERLRAVLVTLLGACTIVAIASWWTSNAQGLWTSAFGLVVTAAAYLLHRRGLSDTAVFLLLAGMLAASTATMSVGAGVHDSGMILYPTIIVIGGLLLKPRTNRLLVLLVTVSVTAVWWLGWTGAIAPAFQSMTDVADLLSLVTVLVVQAVTVNVLARGFSRSLRDARRENAERRIAEAEVRRLNAELEQRVKDRTAELATANAELAAANADLESFSYTVSHDLRAPLRASSNYAGILAEEFAEEWQPSAREFLDRIRASNERMNLLIDDLLRFSRLGRDVVEKRPVDMEAVARGVIDVLSAGSPGRTVRWVVGAMPPAMADPLLMERVYSNLIGNALKYTGRRDDALVEVGFDHDADGPGYFVRDNGVGFDMRHAERLFGPFERLHGEEFEGQGIGLATVQRILARHGGRIRVRSAPGEGSTFRFELPSA